ncbi:MAG: hypothetical protein HC936_04270, partial [Leptolyngbyaceae cyanobacterium SU_3_3]|nr:hypothetical protein [Leptolyngbyaceae cyanobacterium SU_3_3]
MKQSSMLGLALLVTSIVTVEPLTVAVKSAAASTIGAAFTLPASVPKGTTVRIDGSSSMGTVNQGLRQRFEKQFPETQVTVETNGTATALQAVLEDRADLAAIGRPLTAAEKAKGLVAVPVGRDKIAIVVGSNNPF